MDVTVKNISGRRTDAMNNISVTLPPKSDTAKRGEVHSAKPDKFYSLVESCSYAPYIDIFGRKERDGWSVWGENG